jgi:hypothetical protein
MDFALVGNRLDNLTALGASSGPVRAIVSFEKKIDVAPKFACDRTE